MSGIGLELTERQRMLLAALLPVFVLLLINPALDLVASTWPLRFDQITWRFGFFGLVLSSALPMATAAALIALVGGLLGSQRTVRVAALVLGLMAVVVAVSLVLFGLDALQVRRSVPQPQKDRFDASSFKAMAMAALFIPVAGWFTLRLFKAVAGSDAAAKDRKSGLVVGQ